MKFEPTQFDGVWLITLEPRGDERGYLMRTYCEPTFREHGLTTHWPQCNETLTTRRGSIRGMHWQRAPYGEAKLVRCSQGRIWDVVVDVRQGSPTFGQWQAFELDAIDYLSKPIRAERLNLTLQKIQRRLQLTEQAEPCAERIVVIQERGRLLRLPLSQVLYFKAELKYLTVCTLQGEHLLDGSLNDLEQQHGDLFLRTHRSVLVAKSAIESLEKHHDGEEGWALRLRGIPNMLPVSRRQLALVRQAIQRPCA